MDNHLPIDISEKIYQAVKKSESILLHCHPFPDPDSICSVLSLTSVLEGMGKEVTPIMGDSEFPKYLNFLPDKSKLINKKFQDIDINEFDLFLILDSSSLTQVSLLSPVVLPPDLTTIVIDHHVSNQGFGKINLINTSSSSTCETLFGLFESWNLELNSNIARMLLLGIYADTGGFKYKNTSPYTFRVASALSDIYPTFHRDVLELDNHKKPIELEMMGLALSNIQQHCSGRVVFSVIKYDEIKKRNLSKNDAMEGLVGSLLRSVEGWDIVASLVEADPHVVTVSLRTRDESRYDVSKIARAVGVNGGGHVGAAGTTINQPIDEVIDVLLREIKKEYPSI